ncbi:LysM peptidoglycan-binding domain-containing protein [Limibaculum sp. FT325]|uniref:LysM peptidoglycan-binding domain-containing protein n=1 Tax=Thermohalobaculum sediminis TaxID=2939436 RepID=UPI0020C014CF|nr:transporter substrate-binding domain-containing protein [Limibaculum sediminis]MCL5777384.1 LysM peptidoglycan-binding domain-containing protein [Limibaculum sediminis]
MNSTCWRRAARTGGLTALLAAAAVALTAPGAAAQSTQIACGGEPYTIQSGDTLRAIAIRAHGQGNFSAIFEANRGTLSNPSLLRVGQRIAIPCLGDTPASPLARVDAGTSLAAAPATAEPARPSIAFQPALAPAASSGATGTPAGAEGRADLRLLAAVDFAPFVGAGRPGGGMLTELLTAALQRAGIGRADPVTFDGDRAAHLTQMLPQGEHDIAYPWPRPDCARAVSLDRETKWQCSDFVFSAPLYELRFGYYFRAGDETALASDPGVLFGRRLCRPAGAYDADLEAEALVAPNVERVAPPSAAECFALLAAGRVDAVSVSTAVAEAEITAAGLGERVVEAEMLGTELTLHAVALETNETAVAALRAIDAALVEMRTDGAWAAIVARHAEIERLAAR